MGRQMRPCFDFPFDKLRVRSARTELFIIGFLPFVLSVTAAGGEVEGYS